MKLYRGVLASVIAGAVSLSACGSEQTKTTDTGGESNDVSGSVGMSLRLPDDSEVSTVNYTITGPNNYSRTGSIDVANSSVLTFRVGGIPVGNGYTITLTAETSEGTDCMGSASFNILADTTSRVSVLLLCGAIDDDGDVIIDGEFESCAVITSAGAIPGETRVGGTISLSSTISHGMTPVEWTGMGGTFANANSYNATFTCGATPGTYNLTVAIDSTDARCDDSVQVSVICTASAACGNGTVDAGEQCDDGNTVNTDACTNVCRTAVCGDGITGPAPEECDDGNAVNDDACGNTCLANVCGNDRVDPGEQCDGTAGCSPTCRLLGCGDGIVTAPEQCDDGNTVNTDACTNACNNARCGDGIVQTGSEQCDDGNTVDDDSCSNACTPVTQVGDAAHQIAACRTCRQDNCTSFQGVFDLVAGCFQNADPAFVQECIDVKNCAFENDCGYSATGAPECFCGTADLNACQAAGAANGPCQNEWYAAARTTVLAELIGRFTDVNLPAGVAYYFQECDRDFCAACQP